MTENLRKIPLASIDVGGNRARELDPGHAQALADSIRVQGLLYPVLVRSVGEDRFRLVDGLHRHEAFRLIGLPEIPVVLSEKASDDEAMMDQVVANLARRMVALDFCRHLYTMKQAWLRLYPETANGGNKNVLKGRQAARSQNLASGKDVPEITAFDGAMAEKFDLGRSTIKEAVAIWEGLSPASRARLHCTELAGKKTELGKLARHDHRMQARILDLILDPNRDVHNVQGALDEIEGGAVSSRTEKRFTAGRKWLVALPDDTLDRLVDEIGDRLIESLRRQGRL